MKWISIPGACRTLSMAVLAAFAVSASAQVEVEIVAADNPLRIFVEPKAPRATLVVRNSADQDRKASVDVEVRSVHDDRSLSKTSKAIDLPAGASAKVELCGEAAPKFGIYEAHVRVNAAGSAASERSLRWVYVPAIPAGKKWDFFGLNVQELEADEIAELEALGVQWVRTNWNWENITPQGMDSIPWGALQTQADLARQHGLKMMTMLAAMTPPKWAQESGGLPPDARGRSYYFDLDKFDRYATAVLGRFGGSIAAVQLYNEPDWGIAEGLGQKNRTIAEKEDQRWRAFLAEYVHRASKLIRERYPHILIAGPGFPGNPGDPGAWEAMLNPPYRIGQSLDAFAWHNYPAPRSGPPDIGGSSVLPMKNFIRRSKSKVKGRQFWITEQGYTTVDNTQPPYNDKQRWDWAWPVGTTEKQQGDYLVRLMVLQMEAGLDRTFLFQLNRDPLEEVGDGNAYYGLSSHRLKYQKLSFAQLAALGHFLVDKKFQLRIDLRDEMAHALRFGSESETVLIAWSARGDRKLALPPAWKNARAFDGFGNPLPDPDGALTITERPMYLVLK